MDSALDYNDIKMGSVYPGLLFCFYRIKDSPKFVLQAVF